MNKKRSRTKFTHKPVKKSQKKEFKEEDSLEEGKNHFLPMINFTIEKLPSKGLKYPKNAVIKYRPYAWGEVKQISQSKMSEKDQFEFIMDGIKTENMAKEDLTLGDAMYLAIYRKFSTVGGSQIKVQYRCSGCKEKSTAIFNTQDIQAAKMKAPKLPLILELQGKEYKFEPLTIGDYFRIREYLDSNEDVDQDFALIANQCTNAEFDEVYQRLYNITTQDELDDIKDIDVYLDHGLQKIKNKCKNVLDDKEEESDDKEKPTCGHVTDIELDGGQALILPFREDGKRKRSRIRFGDEA